MSEFSKLTWLRRASESDVSDAEFRVLVAIFNHTKGDGTKCYAKQTTLAAETGKSDRQVRRIIPELVHKQWITEVRKGSGRSGLSSEFDLRTPDTIDRYLAQARRETPDTDVRYSDGIPDIQGQNTGHREQEYRTFTAQIPDTSVLPTDPVSDPAIRAGSDPLGEESEPEKSGTASGASEPDIFDAVSSYRRRSTSAAPDPFASLPPSASSAQGGSVSAADAWVTSASGRTVGARAAADPWGEPTF